MVNSDPTAIINPTMWQEILNLFPNPKSLVNDYLALTHDYEAQLNKDLKEQNLHSARYCTHAWKSAASAIGAEPLVRHLNELEAVIAKQQSPRPPLLTNVLTLHKQTNNYLNQLVG